MVFYTVISQTECSSSKQRVEFCSLLPTCAGTEETIDSIFSSYTDNERVYIFEITMLLLTKCLDVRLFEKGIHLFGEQQIATSAIFIYKFKFCDGNATSSKWPGEKES